MRIYIVEDDISVISILEDIIEDHDLGEVCGDCGGQPADVEEVLRARPDVILVDFFMPVMDGVEFVQKLRRQNRQIKCIMISQVSAKELVSKAYSAGIDFFISKPINIIEVTSVLKNVRHQLENEQTLNNIRRMFLSDMAPETREKNELHLYLKKLRYILNRLGMSGEKGCPDIIKICEYLYENRIPASQLNIGHTCELLSDSPKNMEQRIRRAIAAGMSNIAHMGIEDFLNETFTSYSGTLFSFEEIKAEMDYLRGKRKSGGKVSIKNFIDGLMLGRTPDYLGKRIEGREITWCMVAVLACATPILCVSAVGAVSSGGTGALNNAGAHGLSEILYAFTSGAQNNGSAFAGLSANVPVWNVLLALAMFIGRFGVMLSMLVVAGSLAARKKRPISDSSFPVEGPTFGLLLLGIIFIVGALTYLPALSLGPIVEQFQMMRGMMF